jgi:hypothetical protein
MEIVAWDSLSQIDDKNKFILNVKEQALEIIENVIANNSEIKAIFGKISFIEIKNKPFLLKKPVSFNFVFKAGNYWQDWKKEIIVRNISQKRKHKVGAWLTLTFIPVDIEKQYYCFSIVSNLAFHPNKTAICLKSNLFQIKDSNVSKWLMPELDKIIQTLKTLQLEQSNFLYE